MRSALKRLAPLSAALLLFAGAAFAEPPHYNLTLSAHQFQPQHLTVPAAQKIKLNVKNAGATVAEFESYDLNREKIIAGHTTVTLYIGPLKPGRYGFFNDFQREAQGQIVAK
jgi:hypothetical protein